MDDKRKFRRFQLNLPSSLLLENAEAPPVPVTLIDASFGGLGLISGEDFPVGTLISLNWDRPPFAENVGVSLKSRIVSSRRKPSQPGKFSVNTTFLDPDPVLIQKLLHWAQMQSLIQAKARTRANTSARPGGRGFF
ncbi:MAG: PilZ domain-containing protein [bacterium]